MSDNPIFALYDAAIAADKAWQVALVRHYGREACNARYDERGRATVELASLAAAKVASMAAYRDAAYPRQVAA